MGVWQRRFPSRQLWLRRLHQQHLHVVDQQRLTTAQVAVVRRTLRLHHGHHLLQRRHRWQQDRTLSLASIRPKHCEGPALSSSSPFLLLSFPVSRSFSFRLFSARAFAVPDIQLGGLVSAASFPIGAWFKPQQTLHLVHPELLMHLVKKVIENLLFLSIEFSWGSKSLRMAILWYSGTRNHHGTDANARYY